MKSAKSTTAKQSRAEYAREWRAKNKDKTRASLLKQRYGITQEQFSTMLSAQGKACAICGTDSPGRKGWVVDHCHATQAVRGILCTPCNLLLGNARDNSHTLAQAIQYLEKH